MLYDPANQKLLAEGRIMKVAAAASKNQGPLGAVLDSMAEAAAGADVIVSAALTQPGTASVAEKLGVPWVSALRAQGACAWAASRGLVADPQRRIGGPGRPPSPWNAAAAAAPAAALCRCRFFSAPSGRPASSARGR
jgi:hypothetical protein